MEKSGASYQNPVVRGFSPDPSVICVDGMFYMVNSTFQYFPAVVIRESRDLVNWRIIGHAITRPEWINLQDVPDSHGIWAPDISYAEGKFWIFAPLRLSGEGARPHVVLRRQLVMHADKPEGPYSKPICLEVDAIDPSHFVDDDGRPYLVTAPGVTVTPLTADRSCLAGPSKQVWAGTGLPAPEGPHLFKKDDFYYALLAEGGTGYHHQVSVARSKHLNGPYTPCPHNPILTQHDPTAPLQRCGHAKFVQAPDGRWFAFYLCARPLEGKFTVNGRETALQEVYWDQDGWPDMKPPLETAPMPYPGGVQRPDGDFFDDFDSPVLRPEWSFVRTPSVEWSLTQRENHFRIWTENGDLCDRWTKNTLVLRETEHRFTAEIRLSFQPEWEGEQAGLCCYYDTQSYIKCALGKEGIALGFRCGTSPEETLALQPVNAHEPVDLRVVVDGLRRVFFFRQGESEWQLLGEIPRCTFLSDEGIQNPKRHTGAMTGLFATNGGCGSRKPADFDWFRKCVSPQ